MISSRVIAKRAHSAPFLMSINICDEPTDVPGRRAYLCGVHKQMILIWTDEQAGDIPKSLLLLNFRKAVQRNEIKVLYFAMWLSTSKIKSSIAFQRIPSLIVAVHHSMSVDLIIY